MSVGDDPIMRRAFAAQQRVMQGDRAGARELYAALWAEIGESGDAKHRVWIAHITADVQDDPAEEVRWDLIALAAADEIAEAADPFGLDVRAFYPSLHLNLGEGYRKLGDRERARHHLREAEVHAAGQPADDELSGIVAAIAALRVRLDEDDALG